jgi:hypothetical protein
MVSNLPLTTGTRLGVAKVLSGLIPSAMTVSMR